MKLFYIHKLIIQLVQDLLTKPKLQLKIAINIYTNCVLKIR